MHFAARDQNGNDTTITDKDKTTENLVKTVTMGYDVLDRQTS